MGGQPETAAGGGIISGRPRQVDQLDAAQVRDVLSLNHAATDTDGASALSEDTLLRLRPDVSAPIRHLLVVAPTGALLGYAQVNPGVADAEATVEVVVHPQSRRRGVGRALVEAAIDAADGRPLRVWAHGEHPSAAALALDLGFQRARVLWQLRRALRAPVPERTLPAGLTVRPFRPGEDDAAWVEVNRRAFADHPEQGRWTLADLRLRMTEPWFDPAGFLLAVEESSGRLLGFHWTKEHRTADRTGIAARPVGEVYVLGVDPAAHGLGLGGALTAAGLRHLHGRGLDRVMLYADESNRAAMGLYARLGFQRWTAHVQYQRS